MATQTIKYKKTTKKRPEGLFLVWGFGGIIITEKKGEKSPQCVKSRRIPAEKTADSCILCLIFYTRTLIQP